MGTPPTLREVQEADWPAILALANRSVAAVPGAGPQDEWLGNRRSPRPIRRQWVALSGAELVGYVAVESQFEQVPDGFRVFAVAAPEDLATIGPALLERAAEALAALGAREAWLIEYAGDAAFAAFLERHGFRRNRTFRLESGTECVVLGKRLDARRI